MVARLQATATSAEALFGAEPLLEGLSRAEAAWEQLAELSGVKASALGSASRWRARVELDGVVLLLQSTKGDTWGIFVGPDTDPGDAMSPARRLHAVLGAVDEGWDLDR